MINKKIKTGLLFSFLFLVVFVSFFIFKPEARAQDSVGVRLQPAIIEDIIKPGDIFRSILRVTNLSDSNQTYYLISRDIQGLTDNGSPIFAEEGTNTDYSLASWVVFGQPSVVVGPNETKEIPFTVVVPRNAGPGGHFAGIFVSIKPPKVQNIGAGVGYEVATIVSLQVAGDITDQARIREFSAGKLIYTKAEVDFTTVVENFGNVLVRARGPLEITDIFGKKVATLVVNDQGAVVLPESTREFKTTWTGEGLRIGRYQAVLGLSYGQEGKKTITATTSFWILPLNFVLVILVGIIGFIALFFTVTHLYIRRKLVQLNKSENGRDDRSAYVRRDRGSSRAMMFSMLIFAGVLVLVIFMMILFA